MLRLSAALVAAGILVACEPTEYSDRGSDEDGGFIPADNGDDDASMSDGYVPSDVPDGGELPDSSITQDAVVSPEPDATIEPDAGDVIFEPGQLPDLSPDCIGVRYAATSDRIYVEGAGTVCSPRDIALSLEKLKTPLPAGKGLVAIDALKGIYYLGSNLFLQGGAKLNVQGIGVGGDTNELRLKSLNSADPGSFVFIRAQSGHIYFEGTRVLSWDDQVGGPDVEYEMLGRAFIHVRSSLDPDGVTPRESRMDVIRSEISYLGYYAAEAYGLVWKVTGPHTTGSGASLFDLVNVYGDILNSNIHHNYFGVYTYGAHGVVWDKNEVHHNVQYGLDPHDDSDALVITNNFVHHNGNHGIICSRRCDNLRIANNIAQSNNGVGIFLHGFVTDSIVEDNQCLDNTDAGIALFDSHRNIMRRNMLLRNQYGVRLSVGSSSNTFEDNELGLSTKYGIYFYKGTDLPVEGDGRPKLNLFTRNNIHGGAQALKMSDADDNTFRLNSFGTFSNRQVHVAHGVGNVFDANAFHVEDEDLMPIFRIEGNPTTPGVMRIVDHQGPMILTVVGQGTGIVEGNDWQIYSSLFPEGMRVGANGSSLTVKNVSEADLRGEVRALPLFVQPATEGTSALVKTGVWAENRSWTVTPQSQAVSLNYRVGQLVTGACYVVRREGAPIANLAADTAGVVSFADTPRPSGSTSYVLSPSDCP